jgi:hypothetical protein
VNAAVAISSNLFEGFLRALVRTSTLFDDLAKRFKKTNFEEVY